MFGDNATIPRWLQGIIIPPTGRRTAAIAVTAMLVPVLIILIGIQTLAVISAASHVPSSIIVTLIVISACSLIFKMNVPIAF